MTVVRHTTNQILEVWSVRFHTTDQQMVSGCRARFLAFRPYSFASPSFGGFAMSTLRWQLAAMRNFLRLGPTALRHRLSTILRGAPMSEFTSHIHI